MMEQLKNFKLTARFGTQVHSTVVRAPSAEAVRKSGAAATYIMHNLPNLGPLFRGLPDPEIISVEEVPDPNFIVWVNVHGYQFGGKEAYATDAEEARRMVQSDLDLGLAGPLAQTILGVTDYESGQHIDSAEKLAAALGLTLAELEGTDGRQAS